MLQKSLSPFLLKTTPYRSGFNKIQPIKPQRESKDINKYKTKTRPRYNLIFLFRYKKHTSQCALTHKTLHRKLKIKSKNKAFFLNIRKRFKFNGTIQKTHNILLYI
ncbi:hypothetical protein DA099_01815 [Photobacterium damselae]|uniref:Uncharacterized protein n=1 Tax=Photobacterium damselae TaxID=38293 RepID=A0ACD3SXA9_PHODM|nr:hypothetical protein BC461_02725 [Photobacterium damselae]TMX55215.1 hypothetical protein DA099_01815 [Photobacterium damselae]TMX65398.1 hypothetical protein DA090_12035 [Photobacterium damselae]TMX74877.1 hypothetical protein DA092_11615 [Photobacterium damselae]